MLRKNKLLILAGIVAIALVAAPSYSVYWDTVATNALVKGWLNVTGHMQSDPVTLTPVSTTGFTIGSTTSGLVFEVNPAHATIIAETDNCQIGPAGSGVTVNLPTPTAENDGQIIGVRNTTGTTAFISYCGGLPIQTTSGTTPTGIPDAVGDIEWYQLAYNSGISIYVVGNFIQ